VASRSSGLQICIHRAIERQLEHGRKPWREARNLAGCVPRPAGHKKFCKKLLRSGPNLWFARHNSLLDQGAVLLPVASIDASPLNPHKRFVDENLQRLADSLEADRLPQPIVVTPRGRSAAAIGGQAIQVTLARRSRSLLMDQTGTH
jgi:hypothetical protein